MDAIDPEGDRRATRWIAVAWVGLLVWLAAAAPAPAPIVPNEKAHIENSDDRLRLFLEEQRTSSPTSAAGGKGASAADGIDGIITFLAIVASVSAAALLGVVLWLLAGSLLDRERGRPWLPAVRGVAWLLMGGVAAVVVVQVAGLAGLILFAFAAWVIHWTGTRLIRHRLFLPWLNRRVYRPMAVGMIRGTSSLKRSASSHAAGLVEEANRDSHPQRSPRR